MDEKRDDRVASLKFPDHLPGLLHDPGLIGISRAAREVHPPTTHFNEKQHVDRLQEQGLHGEIAGEQLIFVMRHQVAPTRRATPLRSRQNDMPFQDIGNRLTTQLMTKFG